MKTSIPSTIHRPAITKHLLAKYPDIDGEKSRIYLRNAFRHGLKSEALVLARKEGNWGVNVAST